MDEHRVADDDRHKGAERDQRIGQTGGSGPKTADEQGSPEPERPTPQTEKDRAGTDGMEEKPSQAEGER